MRFKIEFNHNDDYQKISNEHIQSWIYRGMGEVMPDTARTLHEQGLRVGENTKRVVKPFVFSRLYKPRKDRIGLTISTVSPEVAFSITKMLLSGHPLTGNGVRLEIKDYKAKEFHNTVTFFTLSPILLKDRNGYVKLSDKEAVYNAVKNNLIGKYIALHGEKTFKSLHFMLIEPFYFAKQIYKGHTFCGVVGQLELAGDVDLVRIAYDCGIGAKNGAGFGCIESVDF